MSDKELMNIYGGAITSTLLNSVARLLNSILDLGRTAGSSVNMLVHGKVCR